MGFKYQAAETRDDSDDGDTVVAINCLPAERTRILALSRARKDGAFAFKDNRDRLRDYTQMNLETCSEGLS